MGFFTFQSMAVGETGPNGHNVHCIANLVRGTENEFVTVQDLTN